MSVSSGKLGALAALQQPSTLSAALDRIAQDICIWRRAGSIPLVAARAHTWYLKRNGRCIAQTERQMPRHSLRNSHPCNAL
eukprot:10460564-Alexandrium_andersonii.AAC.1